MGRRQGGPSRTGGAYLDRYVIDEQRSSQPIFNATLRGRGQLAVFPSGDRRTRSSVMNQIGVLRLRLEKQPTDLAVTRQNSRDLGDGRLDG
jgi:hypothetical protein